MPDLRLQVGNPGYKIRKSSAIDGVEYLGPQPQERIHKEVRRCPVHLLSQLRVAGNLRPGVCRIQGRGDADPDVRCRRSRRDRRRPAAGSARHVWPAGVRSNIPELLARLAQWTARVADSLGLFDAYIERIRTWRAGGRPSAAPDPRFRLTAVADQWRAMLGIP